MPGSKNFYRYSCISCGKRVPYRYTYLYDKEKDGYRCQDCWDREIVGGE